MKIVKMVKMIYTYNFLLLYIRYIPYIGWRNNLNFLTTLTLKWVLFINWAYLPNYKLVKYKLVSVYGLNRHERRSLETGDDC